MTIVSFFLECREQPEIHNFSRKSCYKPPWKYFTDRSKAVLFLWIICVINVLCFSCFCVCSLLPCGHLLGEGWPLGYCFVTFQCGILGHVWYFIISIPDLCHFSYLKYRHICMCNYRFLQTKWLFARHVDIKPQRLAWLIERKQTSHERYSRNRWFKAD